LIGKPNTHDLAVDAQSRPEFAAGPGDQALRHPERPILGRLKPL